jgi:ADP-ribose pyrophosphatase
MEIKKKKLKPWTTLSSEIVHHNKFYAIRHDKYVLPNKEIGDYFVFDKKTAVFVVPVKDGKIIMGKQFRYPIRQWSIEVPGGGVEEGHSPLKVAKQELKEEAGYIGKLKKIGSFATNNGVSSEITSVFLATDLKFIGTKLENTEDIKPLEIDIAKAYEMIENGEIIDSMTISTLSIARKYLLNNSK